MARSEKGICLDIFIDITNDAIGGRYIPSQAWCPLHAGIGNKPLGCLAPLLVTSVVGPRTATLCT
eukprot:3904804-Pyramimonas_sp.AAC.2